MSKLIEVSERGIFERYQEKFALSESDKTWFAKVAATSRKVSRSQQFALQGLEQSNTHLLKSGWAYTATDHSDGSRTVYDVHLPGDFIISPGILSVPRKATLYALSDCDIATLNVNDLAAYTRHSSGANKLFLHLLGHHHEVLADRVIQTTRMPAITRTSWFYLNLLQRIQEISSSVDDQFYSPITQALLAEILGMSEVHVSRTMMRLKALDILVVKNRILQYRNISKLEELSSLQDDFRMSA